MSSVQFVFRFVICLFTCVCVSAQDKSPASSFSSPGFAELEQQKSGNMKVYLLLLLLLPLCSAEQHYIKCYGQDFLMVNNMLLDCTSRVKQACFTRNNGEKGCTRLDKCSDPGWTCCYTDLCNA